MNNREQREYQQSREYQNQVIAYCKAHGQLEWLDFPGLCYRLNDGTEVVWRDGFHITFADGSRILELSPQDAFYLLT